MIGKGIKRVPTATSTVPLRYPLVLGIATLLFVARVLGQTLVVSGDVRFLPPFERWYSGLMPYWLLLPVQIAMIAAMLKIVSRFRARGRITSSSCGRAPAASCMWLSYLYALAMAVRYVVTMTLAPGAALVHRNHPDLVPFRACGLSFTPLDAIRPAAPR